MPESAISKMLIFDSFQVCGIQVPGSCLPLWKGHSTSISSFSYVIPPYKFSHKHKYLHLFFKKKKRKKILPITCFPSPSEGWRSPLSSRPNGVKGAIQSREKGENHDGWMMTNSHCCCWWCRCLLAAESSGHWQVWALAVRARSLFGAVAHEPCLVCAPLERRVLQPAQMAWKKAWAVETNPRHLPGGSLGDIMVEQTQCSHRQTAAPLPFRLRLFCKYSREKKHL